MAQTQRVLLTALATLTAIIFISIGGVIKYQQDSSSFDLNGKLPVDVREQASALQKLSAYIGLPQTGLDEDVCLDEGCLAASYDILNAIDTSVDPCKDFYMFSCGNWAKNNPRPESKSQWDWFVINGEKLRPILTKILSEEKNENDSIPLNQARQYFSQCVGLQDVDEKGLDILKTAVDNIGGWQLLSPERWDEASFDWIKALANTYIEAGQSTILEIFVDAHPNDTDRQIIYIGQPPISGFATTAFTFSWEILANREQNSRFFEDYETYIIKIANALNSTQNENELRNAAKDIIAFEEKLAKLSTRWEDRYKRPVVFSFFKLKDFQAETDKISSSFKISWSRLLKFLLEPEVNDIGEEEDIAALDMDYFKSVITLLAEEEAKGTYTLANYIVWRFVEASLDYSTGQMRSIREEFYEISSREVACTQVTDKAFGMAVAEKYIEQNFEVSSKVEVSRMMEDLIGAFLEVVLDSRWMTWDVKWKAMEKKNALSAQVGYPDWMKEKEKVEKFYEGAKIGESYLESYYLLTRFDKRKRLSALRKRTDRSDWAIPPYVTHAHAVLELNMIVINAGMIDAPFFFVDGLKHQNFGRLGVTLAHEVFHHFNSAGARHDKKGNFVDWWDSDTKKGYEKMGQCLSDQYSRRYFLFKHNPNIQMYVRFINGTLTLEENAADDGGLKLSFQAYKKYVERNGPERRLPGLESFSAEQLFFMGFANTYCEGSTVEIIENQLILGPHTPNYWRVNGVLKNSLDFASAFNCPVDASGMNPPVSEKCTMW